MKKIFCLAMLGLTVLGAYEPIPPAPAGGDSLASHLTFKLDFSNGTKASIARGNATPRLNFQPAYVDGFSGKATTARQSGKVDILRYEMKDNLDVTKPGTLIIRSKILDAGKLPKSAVCLFLTEYRKTGYIPFQGQYRKDGKWGMDLYFIGFEGIGRPSTGTAVDWKPGEWAHSPGTRHSPTAAPAPSPCWQDLYRRRPCTPSAIRRWPTTMSRLPTKEVGHRCSNSFSTGP